jgi:hypothetical protein
VAFYKKAARPLDVPPVRDPRAAHPDVGSSFLERPRGLMKGTP